MLLADQHNAPETLSHFWSWCGCRHLMFATKKHARTVDHDTHLDKIIRLAAAIFTRTRQRPRCGRHDFPSARQFGNWWKPIEATRICPVHFST